MFFNKIYNSWKSIQFEKYEEIFQILGKDFFQKTDAPRYVFSSTKKILDIGCGNCDFEFFLKNKKIKYKIISLDKEENKNLSVKGSGDTLPFKKSSFDLIISIDTMHLIRKNDFKRVLKENGIILFSIFFNKINFFEKKKILKEKLNDFKILSEFVISKKENEYVVVAKKNKVI